MPAMRVLKRNGDLEEVQFDKITERIKKLIYNLEDYIDPCEITKKVVSSVHDKITTSELDVLASELCMNMCNKHTAYGTLAARIAIDNHQKNTSNSFAFVIDKLYNNVDINNDKSPLVSDEVYDIVQKNKHLFENMINFQRDFLLNFFGFKTLMKAYLFKINKIVIERPQHMWLRVAIGIHKNDFEKVEETYELLSTLVFTHATPTLFHSGTPRPQMSSCFLLGTKDSVEGIYKTISDVAIISKWAGGIGCHVSNIRAKNSYIRKTGGYSDGILPMLKVYNNTARYINQSGKRNGSFAMYLEPWHADVFQFLDAKKNHGNEEERARDLFYALWIPDAFMRAVETDSNWYLMCPDESPGLNDVYGEAFDKLYQKYIDEGKYKKKIKARTDLWQAICNAQIETGTPYILFKDTSNKKSNQKNVGTIRSSNLCTEIIEYSDDKEYAVCNLASISLPKFVKKSHPFNSDDNIIVYTKDNCTWCKQLKVLLKNNNIIYDEIILDDKSFAKLKKQEDISTVPQLYKNGIKIGGFDDVFSILRPFFCHDALRKVTHIVTRNLNKIIDLNFYPLPETRTSNLRHRPIGIGVQGLADVFMAIGIPFDSSDAQKLNKEIFETIYFSALEISNQLAIEEEMYETFKGSPLSEGKFQFDLWTECKDFKLSDRWDWELLRQNIIKNGVRNSLLVAPMPTASTSQILGNNECFEPYTNNIYTRRTLAGEFMMVNNWLINDLIDLDLWDDTMCDRLLHYRGSVQKINSIPQRIRDIYKTVWEIKQKVLIDMAADRGLFIDQSQSLNIWMENPTFSSLSKSHFYAWKKGLKTGSYYIRSKPSMNSQSFTIDPEDAKKFEKEEEEDNINCLMCGS